MTKVSGTGLLENLPAEDCLESGGLLGEVTASPPPRFWREMGDCLGVSESFLKEIVGPPVPSSTEIFVSGTSLLENLVADDVRDRVGLCDCVAERPEASRTGLLALGGVGVDSIGVIFSADRSCSATGSVCEVVEP